MSEWSEWLDFDRANIESVPESPGVCMIHASMKVMYIGGGANIRQTLLKCLLEKCTSKAKRFHYLLTPSYDQVKEQMLKEYAEKHGGSLPICMGSQKTL
jgi:hypothetical protein